MSLSATQGEPEKFAQHFCPDFGEPTSTPIRGLEVMGIDDQRTQTLVLRIARCALCEGEHTILYEDDREPSLLTALAADTADDHGSRTNSSNTRFRGMNVEPERYPSKLLGQ